MSTAVTYAPDLLERLRDAGRAGEEIERGAGSGRLAQAREHRHQPALRPEILDHVELRRVERGAQLGDELVRGLGPTALQHAGS